MRFCTAINCMDGRVQLPVINYMKSRFQADYVDMITEPGPCLILAEGIPDDLLQSILKRINISIDKHQSQTLAVVGHFDCAGNPVDRERQLEQIKKALSFLRQRYPRPALAGLWVDENWEVEEIAFDGPKT
jgi:hypothetical protein